VPDLNISVRLSAFDLPLKKALLAASRVGARGVEIDAGLQIRPSDLTDTAKRQIRKMLDDLNLRISSVRLHTRRGYDQLADLDQRIDATKEVMRMAYELGAANVINQIGRVPADNESPGWQQLRSSMEDLGRFGAHVGSFFTAETGTEPGDVLFKLIGTLENSYVAAAFNPGLLIVGDFEVKSSLMALGSQVGIVIAQDGVMDLARGRGVDVPLGYGTADFPEILGTLEDFQYRGWFVVGRPGCGEQEVSNAVSYLTNL
jgi:sugar phosphate isomerase/epimerase